MLFAEPDTDFADATLPGVAPVVVVLGVLEGTLRDALEAAAASEGRTLATTGRPAAGRELGKGALRST